MSIKVRMLRLLSPLLRQHPSLRQAAKSLDLHVDIARHSAAAVLPQIIQPDPREIYVTLTANCNLRCKGCLYGRDFMPGSQLSWPIVKDLLDDCKHSGIRNVRLYGGEPLVHRDIVRIVEHSVDLGLNTWISTNGMLLRDRIDDLFQAGLRQLSIGYYGTGESYNAYVQRRERYNLLERGIAYTRERFGMKVDMTLGWVLMRPTCTLQAVREMWNFAQHYSTAIGVSLIHYSLPYFTEGPDRELQFTPQHRPAVEAVVGELLRLKALHPEMIKQSEMALRSIPDWLIQGPAMNVPCERYRLIWVGADGTVQMCYVTFKMGNLHEKRLSQMLFTPEHRQFARDAFALRCPRCHCSYHNRIEMHAPSRKRYSSMPETAAPSSLSAAA